MDMDTDHVPTNRPGRCRLTLTINGLHYAVRPIVSQDDAVSRAFRLSRNEDVFDVARTVHGVVCDCYDFIFRRDGLDPRGCLHIRAMLAVGLLDPVGVPRGLPVVNPRRGSSGDAPDRARPAPAPRASPGRCPPRPTGDTGGGTAGGGLPPSGSRRADDGPSGRAGGAGTRRSHWGPPWPPPEAPGGRRS